jgi:DNA-directed RNA polymerase subunit RPC12/RpoP
MVHRCLQCGSRVRHRIVEGNPWLHCPTCRGA